MLGSIGTLAMANNVRTLAATYEQLVLRLACQLHVGRGLLVLVSGSAPLRAR